MPMVLGRCFLYFYVDELSPSLLEDQESKTYSREYEKENIDGLSNFIFGLKLG